MPKKDRAAAPISGVAERGAPVARTRAYAWIVLLVAVAFANGIGGAFVWDDEHLIVENRNIGSSAALGLAFTADYYTSTAAGDRLGYYRPVVVLANHLDFALWGFNPVGFHLTNVVAHALVCLLIFELALLLSSSSMVALVSAALFAVHPVHTESVTFISGRTDLLATLGFCAAWWLALIGLTRERKALVISAPFVFFVALLAKEIAVTLPVVLALCVWLDRPHSMGAGPVTARMRRIAVVVWPYLLALAVYVVLRAVALGHVVRPAEDAMSFFARTATAAKLFGHHVSMAFLPTPWLRIEPVVATARGWGDPGSLLGVGAAAVLLLLAWRMRGTSLAALGLLFFMVALVPALNLIPLETRIAERFLYLPTVGLCMFGGSLLGLMRTRDRRLFVILVVTLVVIGTGFTIYRNHQWRDGQRLWRHVIAHDPDHPVAWYQLGVELERRGRIDAALPAYVKATEVNPFEERSYFNIGVILERRGQREEAERMYRRMIEIGRPRGRALNNLAALVGTRGDLAEATRLLEQATTLEPDLEEAWFNLAVAYEAAGRRDDAARAWRAFLSRTPSGPDAEAARARLEALEARATEPEK